MNKELLDYVKDLTKKDKKTLTQKVAKLFEEGGELAKAVLPFESAYACRHRFVDKQKILEEVCDTILVALSIAYDLECTDEEIEDVMDEKSQIWQGLQVSEEQANFPLPYEIHVTVEVDQEKKQDDFISLFKSACEKLEVKPIVLDLSNKGSVVMKDVMTSSKHYGDNRTAYEEMKRISGQLSRLGYKVVREKIETAPWHPGAPKKPGTEMPKNCYFESHVGVMISTNPEEREELEALARRLNGHLSKNTFKKVEDDKYVIMLTIRDYHVCREEFEQRVKEALIELKMGGWNIPKKEVVEFAIYDTKISHDYLWLK